MRAQFVIPVLASILIIAFSFTAEDIFAHTFLDATFIESPPRVTGFLTSGFGTSSAIGDFNGDGFDDAVIGAPNTNSQSGGIVVFLGPDLTNPIKLTAPSPFHLAFFGSALTTADVNNDGNDDVIIGAPQGNHGPGIFFHRHGGQAFIMLGPDFTTTFDISNRVPGQGHSVATGDVNNDGNVDVITGARSGDKVHVFLGPDFTNSIEIINPIQSTSEFLGSSVAVGDINNDGIDDVIAGDSGATIDGLHRTGAAIVFFGPTLTTSQVISSPVPNSNGGFGVKVASADVNADGIDDVIVSQRSPGKTFVFLGPDLNDIITLTAPMPVSRFGSFSTTTGDVDSDGNEDVIVGAFNRVFAFLGPSLTDVRTYVHPTNLSSDFGQTASTGDVTGDGLTDMIVGDKRGSDFRTGQAIFFEGRLDIDNDKVGDEIEFALTGSITGLDLVICDDLDRFRATLDSGSGEITFEGIIVNDPVLGIISEDTIVSFTLPSGSTVPTGSMSFCHSTVDDNSEVQLLGVNTSTSGKSVKYLSTNPLPTSVCFVDNDDNTTLVSQLGAAGCPTDTSISQVYMVCPPSPGSNSVTLSGFPDEPSTRTYTCQRVIEDDSTFIEMTGLQFSTITEFADIDGDGITNLNDQCPVHPGFIELQGCVPIGEVTFVNNAEKLGSIERTDDGTNDKYQFRIPLDLVNPNVIPSVGDTVAFIPIKENARLATNVGELIVNNPPTIVSVTITPTGPLTSDTITCNANDVIDLDGHPLALMYSWLRDDGTLFATGNPLAPSRDNSGILICEVTAFDGIDTSVPIQSDPVTVIIDPCPPNCGR